MIIPYGQIQVSKLKKGVLDTPEIVKKEFRRKIVWF